MLDDSIRATGSLVFVVPGMLLLGYTITAAVGMYVGYHVSHSVLSSHFNNVHLETIGGAHVCFSLLSTSYIRAINVLNITR